MTVCRRAILAATAVALAGAASSASTGSFAPRLWSSGSGGHVLVDFVHSGGERQFDDRLTVYQIGSYKLTRPNARRRGWLTDADLGQLRRLLEEADFARLPTPELGAGGTMPSTYGLTHDGHTVSAMDGGIAERALAVLIEELTGLIDRYASP